MLFACVVVSYAYEYGCSHTPPELKDTWPAGMNFVLRKVIIPVLAFRYSG
jgi:hypothetical protein